MKRKNKKIDDLRQEVKALKAEQNESGRNDSYRTRYALKPFLLSNCSPEISAMNIFHRCRNGNQHSYSSYNNRSAEENGKGVSKNDNFEYPKTQYLELLYLKFQYLQFEKTLNKMSPPQDLLGLDQSLRMSQGGEGQKLLWLRRAGPQSWELQDRRSHVCLLEPEPQVTRKRASIL